MRECASLQQHGPAHRDASGDLELQVVWLPAVPVFAGRLSRWNSHFVASDIAHAEYGGFGWSARRRERIDRSPMRCRIVNGTRRLSAHYPAALRLGERGNYRRARNLGTRQGWITA